MIEYFWTGNGKTEHEVNLMPKSLEGKIIPVTSFCGIELPNGVRTATRFYKGLTGSEPCKECENEKKRLLLEDPLFLEEDKRDLFTQRITELLSTIPGDLRKSYQILSDTKRGDKQYKGESRSYEFCSSAIWLFHGTHKIIEYRHYREWEIDPGSDQLGDSLDAVYLFKEDPIGRRVLSIMSA